jgi:hypothetical protein
VIRQGTGALFTLRDPPFGVFLIEITPVYEVELDGLRRLKGLGEVAPHYFGFALGKHGKYEESDH